MNISLRREIIARLSPRLPEKLRLRLVPEAYAWSARDLKPVARGGRGDVRCLIAPANFAEQGFLWSRAAETLPGVSCSSLSHYLPHTGFSFRSDVHIHQNVSNYSHLWGKKQRELLAREFTHVLVEAGRNIYYTDRSMTFREHIEDLQSLGLKVGLVWHGSDVRLPSLHAQLERYSPFRGSVPDSLRDYEEVAQRNIDAVPPGIPEFVSTVDLLRFRPNATWLPTVIEPEPWASLPPIRLGERRPVVLHTPTRTTLKGTESIRAAMSRLEAEGVIEYREVQGVSHAQMPSIVAQADIVIDQVGMGIYGVSSVEAMMAGRIAVAQVWKESKDFIVKTTGSELPIVDADPDRLETVIREIVNHPEENLTRSTAGQRYAAVVHSSAAAAKALAPFLAA